MILLGAAFAIAGCAEEAAEEPASEEVVVEEAAPEVAVANTMDVTFDDGETATLVLYDNGTYTLGEATGTYREREDGMTCYIGDEEGAEESCWAPSVENPDGSVTSTSEDGEVVVLSEATT